MLFRCSERCFPEREELTREQSSIRNPDRTSGDRHSKRRTYAKAGPVLGVFVGDR
jgi:hypothetical protein